MRDFSPPNDDVLIADIPALRVTNSFTFLAWIIMDAISRETIITKGDSAGSSEYIFQIARDDNTSRISLFDGAAPSWKDVTKATPFNTGQLYHVMWSFDDINHRGTVDGVEEGTVASTVDLGTSTDPLRIGQQGNIDNTNNFDGRMGLVAIWNIVMSNVMKTALFNGVHPIAMRPDGLVLLTHLNGNDSPEGDYGPNQLTGTLDGTSKASTNPPVQLLSRYMSGH